MSTNLSTSVVVVGGSLVGLSTALFLSDRGVPVVLVERHPASSLHPRAIGYTSRTIELLRAVGADKGLPASGGPGGPPRRISVQSLAGKWSEEQSWSRKPGGGPPVAGGRGGGGGAPGKPPGPGMEYSPSPGIGYAQDKIEPLLRDRATELGADLRLGYKVTSWHQDDKGVSVTSVDKDGQELAVSAQYLVACDGAKSPIREALGIQRQGVGHIRQLRSILFRCAPLEKYFQRGYRQFQIEGRDDGFEAFMTTYGDGRLALMWNDTAADAHMDDATQKSWIRKAAGEEQEQEEPIPDSSIELITTGQWDIGGHVAEHFSSGRVFLAGDAAHALPPNRGGYGANTGIADAWDVAWKLAAVVSGRARAALLGSYDAERRPVALVRHDQIFMRDDHARFIQDRGWEPANPTMLDEAAVEYGQLYRSGAIVCGDGSTDGLPDAMKPDEWRGQPGTRAPHMKLLRGEEAISSLDLLTRAWVVLAEDASWSDVVGRAAEATGTECTFTQVGGAEAREEDEGTFERLFGVGRTGAVLVRPDGVIAWKAESKPNDDVSSMFERVLAQASYSVKGGAA